MSPGSISQEARPLRRCCQQGQRLSTVTIQDSSVARYLAGCSLLFSTWCPQTQVSMRLQDQGTLSLHVSAHPKSSPVPQPPPNQVPRDSQENPHTLEVRQSPDGDFISYTIQIISNFLPFPSPAPKRHSLGWSEINYKLFLPSSSPGKTK